jgi:hypothetical protein
MEQNSRVVSLTHENEELSHFALLIIDNHPVYGREIKSRKMTYKSGDENE